MKKSYLQLKIVSDKNYVLEELIKEYEYLGFVYEGFYQEENGVYWAFLNINNGLIQNERKIN